LMDKLYSLTVSTQPDTLLWTLPYFTTAWFTLSENEQDVDIIQRLAFMMRRE